LRRWRQIEYFAFQTPNGVTWGECHRYSAGLPFEMSDHQSVDIGHDEVRRQLDRMLASETFANAGRLSRLLKFIVDRALAGEGDHLKEYLLGVEVFDRGERYDPRLDSIVRVEARRLRAKLDEYYASAGINDPVVIAVARGSYVPTFARPSAQAPASTSRRGVTVMALLTAATLLIVTSVSWRWQPAAAPAVVVAVLPFEQHSGTPEDERLASRLTDAITSELARLNTVGVVSRTSARQFEGVRRPVREIAQSLNANVLLEATVETSNERVVLTARLVDGIRDRKMWVENFESSRADVARLARDVAGEVAAVASRRSP
jgi:adenylate cyclase